MIVVRPIDGGDLDRLEALAVESGPGMTNLPANRDVLEAKIRASLESFARTVSRPGEESYLLVGEDTASGRVIGTTGMIASVGESKPFYSYKILSLVHSSLELNKFESVRVLQMVNEYRGATEIATLYLTPEYRKDGNGRLLSRSRFLYMAEFPERFSPLVMAEMRGVHDADGRSLFWESLGRHFIGMDFNKADYLSSLGRYQFIADLMPSFPIYIRLLPKPAQDVIGVPHEETRPALKLLEREGFRFEGCVDVFDAGPTVHAPLEQIRTVAASSRAVVGEVADALESETYMIANTRADRFRLCRGPLVVNEDASVRLTREVAGALQVAAGDSVRFARF